MRVFSRQALACGTSAAILLSAGAALAQEAAGPAVLEEIIVTAQRRSERLQDVPVTVTAFSAEEIAQARLRQIDDIASRTPGLNFDAFPASQPRVSIRGIGSSDRGAAGDPSSAVFLDEVYMGRPAAVAFDAFDVSRIEVLKGPQGTLYGRNVVGGAINVVSNRPELDRTDAGAEGTVGNYERLEAAAYANIPLAEGKWAARASGAWRTHDGYVKNTFTDGRVEDQDTRSGRFQIYGEPSETVRVLLGVDGTRDRATGPAQHTLDLDPTDPRRALWTVDRDRKHTAGSDEGYQDRDTWGVRGQLDWDLPFASVTYLGSYRDLDYHVAYDFDGGHPPTNRLNISGGNDEDSQFSSHEVRLNSLPDSTIQWVAGLYNFNNETDRVDTLVIDQGRPATEIYTQAAKLNSYAAFGDVTVPLGEQFSLIGGLRYSKDEKDYSISNTAGTAVLRGTERFAVSVSDSYDAWTWRGGAQYKLDRDHQLYAMVSRGFKSGGFQDTPSSAASAADGFEPEFATQYEVGQKSSFLDGHLIWNNTLYVMKYTDLQTMRTLPDLSIVTENAGKATIKGYETQLTWSPFTGARLAAAYAYTDATFDEFAPEPGVDFAGNRISRTPRHKIVLSPSYEASLGDGAGLLFAVDYRYESMIFDDNSNVGPERRPSTQFVDARATYSAASGNWTLSLWGKNLTQEVTRTHQVVFLGANFGSYSPPRTFGATVGWKL
ncbi:TonB-dependent receptor [Niveispirillum sp. KHB5.9]|uniref:TonB-dependent receptor n=1 Tax=Niveispirillum sp. KHB5.9 TaxID=3400269 RepID=UPI003A8665DE